MGEYVEVFAASDITFAYLMKANLEEAGITTVPHQGFRSLLCYGLVEVLDTDLEAF